MKTRKSNPRKDALVKEQRGFSPQEIVDGGVFVDELDHKTNTKQKIEVYIFQNYTWAVIVEGDRLVTAYKSRKLKKEFGS